MPAPPMSGPEAARNPPPARRSPGGQPALPSDLGAEINTRGDGSASAHERGFGSLREHHDLHRELQVGAIGPGPDEMDELGELSDEGLAGWDPWREDIPASIGELILAKRLRILVDDAPIEYSHWLRGSVLVDDHLLAAHDGSPAELAWCQPAELDVCDDPRWEPEGYERDVVDALNDGVAAARDD